jgi:hypothetical protein
LGLPHQVPARVLSKEGQPLRRQKMMPFHQESQESQLHPNFFYLTVIMIPITTKPVIVIATAIILVAVVVAVV